MSKSYSVDDIINNLAKKEKRNISSSFIYKNVKYRDVHTGNERKDEMKEDGNKSSNVVISQELGYIQKQRDNDDGILSHAKEYKDSDDILSHDKECKDTYIGKGKDDDEKKEEEEGDNDSEHINVVNLCKANDINNITNVDHKETFKIRRLYLIDSLKKIYARKKKKSKKNDPLQKQKTFDDLAYISGEDIVINNPKEKEKTDCLKCFMYIFNRLVTCFELLIKIKSKSSVV
uniref:Uncharacterized protein n=1 Tax=Penaeus monodon majanivirus B TaxID=2984272 RepID=A0A9C7CEA2_9VIRU|nr:MAG: hypothetical protein [Penaeus monodon majanivirus B]